MQLTLPLLGATTDGLKQGDLFAPTQPRQPSFKIVEDFFAGLTQTEVDNYSNYWKTVAPQSFEDHFLRWIFAYMSVHTSWKANVTGYNALKNWSEWINDKDILLNKLKDSRVGLHNNRAKYVWEFANKFWDNPSDYVQALPACWREMRNGLVEKILGLGMAKTSFSLEMSFPLEAEVVCMDTHLFQAYGLDQTKDLRHYDFIESHWINLCRSLKIPCYIARCLLWDKKQKKTDSRYWSYILEN